MAGLAICQRSELSQRLAGILRPQQELFAAYVASGVSYRKSARRAKYHEDHGSRLMRKPAIEALVEELRDASNEERFLATIQAKLFLEDDRESSGGLKEVRSLLRLANAQERILRLIEGRKKAAGAKLGFRDISRAELGAIDEREMEWLSRGQRAELRRLAAGELAAADNQSAE